MRINCNISSIIAKNALNNNDLRLSNSMQRLSSGYKINNARDNAAGLAIARKMNAQIKGLQQANDNANDGISVVNTVDGAMAEMHDILQRMSELSVQAATGTLSDTDRGQIQLEIDQLIQEIDRIADTTQFNSQNLLDGSFAYKGYTNAENIRVMSYSDGVQKGIYAIDSLTYYHYEDKVTTYSVETKKITNADGTTTTTLSENIKSIVTEDRFEAKSADDIQNALFGTASINAYQATSVYDETLRNGSGSMQAFSDSVRVTLDKENVILKGINDFEVKISLNENTAKYVDGNRQNGTITGADNTTLSTSISANRTSGVTTSTVSSVIKTECYKNITVKVKGEVDKYSITELNFAEEYDITGKNKLSDAVGKELGGEGAGIYTSSSEVGLRDLEEDFADLFKEMYPDCDVSVVGITYNKGAAGETFTMEISATDKKTGKTVNFDSNGEIASTGGTPTTKIELELYQEKDENGKLTEKTLANYHYSSTETIKTRYTIGKEGDLEDSITLDLTGMGPMVIQVGANAGQDLEIEIPAVRAINLGVDDLDLTTQDKATASIDVVGKAIDQLSSIRAKIGAYTNRLEHIVTNLNTSEENMTASYSRIMDVDMATEMTEYSTVQVLVQSATSMLAQANERPQQVLQLLQ